MTPAVVHKHRILLGIICNQTKLKAAEAKRLISSSACSDLHEHIIFIIDLKAVAKKPLMHVIRLARGAIHV